MFLSYLKTFALVFIFIITNVVGNRINDVGKVLVLGSNGLIGTYLVNELVKNGYTVLPVYNRTHIDLRNQTLFRNYIKDSKVIFCYFLAFEVGGSKYIGTDNQLSQIDIIENNVLLYQSVLPVLYEFAIPYVFTSSYMQAVPSPYGTVKRLGEAWVNSLNNKHLFDNRYQLSSKQRAQYDVKCRTGTQHRLNHTQHDTTPSRSVESTHSGTDTIRSSRSSKSFPDTIRSSQTSTTLDPYSGGSGSGSTDTNIYMNTYCTLSSSQMCFPSSVLKCGSYCDSNRFISNDLRNNVCRINNMCWVDSNTSVLNTQSRTLNTPLTDLRFETTKSLSGYSSTKPPGDSSTTPQPPSIYSPSTHTHSKSTHAHTKSFSNQRQSNESHTNFNNSNLNASSTDHSQPPQPPVDYPNNSHSQPPQPPIDHSHSHPPQQHINYPQLGKIVRFWNVYGREQYGPRSHVITDWVHGCIQAGIKTISSKLENTISHESRKDVSVSIEARSEGKENRQFLHAADAARALRVMMEQFSLMQVTTDISSGEWLMLREVGDVLKRVVTETVFPSHLQKRNKYIEERNKGEKMRSKGEKMRNKVEKSVVNSVANGVANSVAIDVFGGDSPAPRLFTCTIQYPTSTSTSTSTSINSINQGLSSLDHSNLDVLNESSNKNRSYNHINSSSNHIVELHTSPCTHSPLYLFWKPSISLDEGIKDVVLHTLNHIDIL